MRPTTATSPLRRQRSFYLPELFKIKHQAIDRSEANFITVLYRTPSPSNKQ